MSLKNENPATLLGLVSLVMPSIISNNIKIKGKISSKGDTQFDGFIEGNIVSHKMTIGKLGVIKGNIHVEELHVHGTIVGNIIANIINISATAKVTGDISFKIISVVEGSNVQGQFSPLQSNTEVVPKYRTVV